MSVRKPLLSTSARKRRGVTIIFNHDYDRVISVNETVNLISNDCLSYLRRALATGLPHRKTMVMAGENVCEGQEAQEATAGDKRAIVHADQARQLHISGETRAESIAYSWTAQSRCKECCTTQRMYHS